MSLTSQELKEFYDSKSSYYEELADSSVENITKEFRKRLYAEDPRKVGLKKGLKQLTLKQLHKLMDKIYKSAGNIVLLDEYTYQDGKFCPLALGVGFDETFKNPTNEKVFAALVLMGYTVFNTRGVTGDFYQTNRLQDLITATIEVIEEKKKIYCEELNTINNQVYQNKPINLKDMLNG